MISKPFAILVLLFVGPCYASGYGWYVSSLDWESLNKARPLIAAKAAQYRSKNPDSGPGLWELEAVGEVIHPSDEVGTPIVSLFDESPAVLEFYWPDALHYAFNAQKQRNINSFFRYFENGRLLSQQEATAKCDVFWKKEWGYCMDAYIFFSPTEVKKFWKELSDLNARVNHPTNYSPYLVHLEGVLRKAMAEDRSLYFRGHD